jgi:hypothetical protein
MEEGIFLILYPMLISLKRQRGGRMFSVLTWELGTLMHLISQMFLFWGEMPSFSVPWL